MSQPLVSILVTCYNASPFLEETLKCIVGQTYENKEVILVNDGSTDQSLEIARRFESDHFKIIDQKNAGQSRASNTAFEASVGKYVSYFDSDDLMCLDRIEKQVEALESFDGIAMASCEYARFFASLADAQSRPNDLWQNLSPIDWTVIAWEQNLMKHPGAWLIPRTIIEEHGGYHPELTLINDYEFYHRIMMHVDQILHVPGVTTYYRSGNASSVSQLKTDKAWTSAFRAVTLAAENLVRRENSDRTRHACAVAFQRFIYESYPQVPALRAIAETRVKEYGGCRLVPELGGNKFNTLRKLTGWKLAKRIKKMVMKNKK